MLFKFSPNAYTYPQKLKSRGFLLYMHLKPNY